MTVESSSELLEGATQLLKHLQRCGLQRVPVGSSEATADWPLSDAKIRSLQGGRIPTTKVAPLPASATNSPQATMRSDAASTQPLTSQSVANAPSKPPVSSSVRGSLETLQVAESYWLSPTLDAVQREACFADLRPEVGACRKCQELASTRKQTVFGVGSLTPRVVFFGEAPGADEDRLGEPFVGAAGQLLTKIIHASKMKREEVYILNSLKCRPPGNRTPFDEEIANCRPFFEKQLEVLQPEYIVCLGAVAARSVLRTTESVGRLRGRFHRYRNAKVLVTYHPSYLLRNEGAKKFVWEDMQSLMKEMGLM